MRFLEHLALATYAFSEHERAMRVPEHWATMPSHVLGRILLGSAACCTDVSCRQTLLEWDVAYGVLAASIHAWNVWGPLAEALARGSWHADVSVKFRRDADGHAGQAPVMPSQRLLRYLVTPAKRRHAISRCWRGSAATHRSQVGLGTLGHGATHCCNQTWWGIEEPAAHQRGSQRGRFASGMRQSGLAIGRAMQIAQQADFAER